MEDICKRLPCISLIPDCGQSIRHLHISHFSHYIIYLGFPLKIAHKHCLQFLLGGGDGRAGANKVYYGRYANGELHPCYNLLHVGYACWFAFVLRCGYYCSVSCQSFVLRDIWWLHLSSTPRNSRKMTKLYDIKSRILRLAQVPTSPLTPIGSFIHFRRVRYSAKCVIGRSWSTAWGPSLVMMWRHFTGDQSPRLRMLLNENFQWIR